jgi:Domain of unknown function (DUF1707)
MMTGMAEVLPSGQPERPVPSRVPTGPYVARRDLRVSDAERQAVVDELRTHFGAGRIDLAEFEERTQSALAARVRGDLHPLLDDLPDLGPAPQPGPPVRRKPGSADPRLLHNPMFLTHLYVTLVISVFLVVIWAATGGADSGFWPVYPIAGLCVPLGRHAAIRKGSSPPNR